jgi:hypothetical protein
VIIYATAAPPPPPAATAPPAHDAVDEAYKQQIMDNCMGTIGFRPQCVCITNTLVQDADKLGWTYRKIYEAWVSAQSGALNPDQFKKWIADVGLTPCFNY